MFCSNCGANMKEIREQNNTVSEVNSNTKISGKKVLQIIYIHCIRMVLLKGQH